jgi:hypothetical protein
VEATSNQEITPHRTILATPQCALRITGEPSDPAARLGTQPARSFGDVWAHLPECPFDTGTRRGRLVDAQLRRITAWSTGLQYIADYTAAYCSEQSDTTADEGDDDTEKEVSGGGAPGWEVTSGRAATYPVSSRVGADAGDGCDRRPAGQQPPPTSGQDRVHQPRSSPDW